MNGSATITVDRECRILTFHAEGFFDEEGVTRLAEKKAAALRSLGGRPSDHVSIVDVTKCKIQSQEIVVAFASLIQDRTSASKRLAFVAGPGCLMRMQLRRMKGGEEVSRLFDDVASAKQWLMDES